MGEGGRAMMRDVWKVARDESVYSIKPSRQIVHKREKIEHTRSARVGWAASTWRVVLVSLSVPCNNLIPSVCNSLLGDFTIPHAASL